MQKNKILVGVVVYNEESKLTALLKNIEKTIIANNYNFLLVDDKSTDRSAAILKSFLRKNKRSKLSQTDTSNGFRAYKLTIFKNKNININQSWLDRYELETYIHYKVITLGYKICEVPVSKNYLPGVKNYSKIRPVIDWWRMMRPLFYLKLGIKS
jgi:glycosyltransferase involved in cell wall biosynthesis